MSASTDGSPAETGAARAGVRTDAADGVHTLWLDRPPGNVLDTATCEALADAAEAAGADPECRLVVVRGAGGTFSWGADVAEHLPEDAPAMLAALGRAVRTLDALPVPTVAAIEGRCLGGGFEVALACGRMICTEDAVLGSPEIRLGVFAPAATAWLARRVPRAVAEDWLFTGRDVTVEEAARWGLVTRTVAPGGLDDAVADAAAALERLSPASLRMAVRALRGTPAGTAPADRLEALERLYLDELMALHDGTEGIRAFLDKRRPEWRNA